MVAQFFDAPPPPPTDQHYGNGLSMAGGVSFGAAGALYFKDATTIDPSLTATVAGVGRALAPSPPLGNYGGTGGTCDGGQPCRFQTTTGASTAGVVFVSDFYACNYDPTANGCM
jgi:hypothetical protein